MKYLRVIGQILFWGLLVIIDIWLLIFVATLIICDTVGCF